MRKKWLSRALAAMLAGVLAVGLLAGCGAEEKKEESKAPAASSSAPAASSSAAEVEEKYEVSYPMTGLEDVELRVYIGGGQPLSSGMSDYNDVPFWQGFAERTGINCIWEYPVAGADATAAYNLMLTEEELPHIVIGYYSNTAQQADLLADGIVFPIDEYIEEYAPDFYAFMQTEQAQGAARLYEVEGQLTCFPSFRSSAWGCTYQGPLVRQDWLDEQGLKAPTTVEEMENVLTVFKEKYNAFLTHNNANAFISGFDAFAGWQQRYYVDANDEIQMGNFDDETREYIATMAEWYEKGLLDPNFYNGDNAYHKQLAVEEKIGMIWQAISQQTEYINGAKAAGLDANWVGFENLVGKDGIAHFIQTEYSTFTGSFGAYITNACDTEEELKAAMAWINYAFTEEGKIYWNFGTEGESYEMVDGKAVFTEKVTSDERGMTQALRDWTGASAMPVGIQLEEFVRAKNNPACGESVDKWVANQDAAKYWVPGLPFTADENAAKKDLDTALGTYIKEQSLKFITGERSMDEWDAYLGELESMGSEDALKIYRDAYARFKAQ